MSIAYFIELPRSKQYANKTVGFSHCHEFLLPGSEGAYIEDQSYGTVDYLQSQYGINHYSTLILNRSLNFAEDSFGIKRKPPTIFKSVTLNLLKETVIERYWIKCKKDIVCFYSRYHDNQVPFIQQTVNPRAISMYNTDVYPSDVTCPTKSILEEVLNSNTVRLNKDMVYNVYETYKNNTKNGSIVALTNIGRKINDFVHNLHLMATSDDLLSIDHYRSKTLTAMQDHLTVNDPESSILKSPIGFNYISLNSIGNFTMFDPEDDPYEFDTTDKVIVPDTYKLKNAVYAAFMIASTKFVVEAAGSKGSITKSIIEGSQNYFAPIADKSLNDWHFISIILREVYSHYTHKGEFGYEVYLKMIKNDCDEIIVEVKNEFTGKYPDAIYYFDIPFLALAINGLQLA